MGRWKLFERCDIADYADPGDVYLKRWNLLTTPWFGIKIHHIRRPDADRVLHTHPWGFVTFILRGGYVEEMGPQHKIVHRRPGSVARHPSDHRHRIAELRGRQTWTFVLTGPKVPNEFEPGENRWGFWVDDDTWVYWKDYLYGGGRVAVHLPTAQDADTVA